MITTSFEDRQGRFIFVKVPGEYGRYVRTTVSVVLAACPACRSETGVPCRGQYDRYTGSVHADRMAAARRVLIEMMPGKNGGPGKAIADDYEEPPLARDDVVDDKDEPSMVGHEKSLDNADDVVRSVVDLREMLR